MPLPACLIALAAVLLAGCATTPTSNGRTQYKGDAVWNISSSDEDRAIAVHRFRTVASR